MSLLEEPQLPQRAQQREIDEYAADSLRDEDMKRPRARPDPTGDFTGTRSAEALEDFETQPGSEDDFSSGIEDEGFTSEDMSAEAQHDFAAESMEEERFEERGPRDDIPGGRMAEEDLLEEGPRGMASAGTEGGVEAELEAEMEQREEAEWRAEEREEMGEPQYDEGDFSGGASEAQAELRREEDVADRQPVFECVFLIP